jgi:colanic acid/amylovoran biosynthesis protein
MINQGFEAQNKLLRKMLRLSLSKADFISVRDSDSLSLASQLKLDVPVSFGPDMVFSLSAFKKTINHHPRESAEKIIGVNIRPLFWWAHDLGYVLSEKVVASVLDQLIEQRNVKIVFVPFRLSGKEDYSDQEASEGIISKMKHNQKASIFVCPLDETLFSKIEACYNTFDFFIGTALHSIILSCRLNVPFIALPYQKKSEKLLDDLSLNSLAVSPNELSSADLLLARLLRAFDERQKTKVMLSPLSEELHASSAKAHLSFSINNQIDLPKEGVKITNEDLI